MPFNVGQSRVHFIKQNCKAFDKFCADKLSSLLSVHICKNNNTLLMPIKFVAEKVSLLFVLETCMYTPHAIQIFSAQIFLRVTESTQRSPWRNFPLLASVASGEPREWSTRFRVYFREGRTAECEANSVEKTSRIHRHRHAPSHTHTCARSHIRAHTQEAGRSDDFLQNLDFTMHEIIMW